MRRRSRAQPMAWITIRSKPPKIVPSLPVGDFTPDPFYFYDSLNYEDGQPFRSNISIPGIQGIDNPIDVRLVLTSGAGGTVYYRTASGRVNPDDIQYNPGAWSVLNFTLNQSATITVNPGFKIGFAVDVIAAGVTNTYQLRNLSDANTLLTTFTATRVAISFDYGTFANPTGTDRDYNYEYNDDFGVVSGGSQGIVEE